MASISRYRDNPQGLFGLQRIRIIPHERQGGVGRREKMIVNAELVGALEHPRPEVARRTERHVTPRAVALRDRRIVKAPRAVA